MTIKIGSREVVFSTSLIIPKNETAEFDFTVDLWHISIRIEFLETSDESQPREVKFDVQSSQLIIKFVNWNNALGTAILQPHQIGLSNNGQALSFIATHWLVGDVNRIDVQFLLGDAK